MLLKNLRKVVSGSVAVGVAVFSMQSQSVELLINGSFETGDLTGWEAKDINAPFYPMDVRMGGASPGFGFFVSQPTDGQFALTHGFDGGGPDTIEIEQDVEIPQGFDAMLTFDWRAAWDLTFEFRPQARLFDLVIEDASSSALLLQKNLLTADPISEPSNPDTGSTTESIDLSEFSGSNISIKFVAFIPEFFTGPAHLQLDNVSLDIVRRDSDLDGVLDETDRCPGTLIPESISRSGLKPNRHALIDGDSTFDTVDPYGGGTGPEKIYSTEQTKGCSCEQIIELQGLGKGHAKFGCSSGVMEKFVRDAEGG